MHLAVPDDTLGVQGTLYKKAAVHKGNAFLLLQEHATGESTSNGQTNSSGSRAEHLQALYRDPVMMLILLSDPESRGKAGHAASKSRLDAPRQVHMTAVCGSHDYDACPEVANQGRPDTCDGNGADDDCYEKFCHSVTESWQ